MKHIAFVIVVCAFVFGFSAPVKLQDEAQKGDEMTIEKAPIAWQEKDYNPIWDVNLWFQVDWPDSPDKKNKKWNIYVHPDNLKVDIDKNLSKSALSAEGKANKDLFWHKLQADSATLYVSNSADKEQWNQRLQHLRDGLRRGFNGMSYEKVEAWSDGKAYVTVRDLFWNAGDPMMILVSRDKISVVVDEKVGRGQRYVAATNAKVFYKGNSRDPRARLEAESVTISVATEGEAQKLKDEISKLPDE